ncbi:MAG: hypothetical protein ACOX88_01525 [Christensenellales bacterium]|jgi:hypothetical protein
MIERAEKLLWQHVKNAKSLLAKVLDTLFFVIAGNLVAYIWFYSQTRNAMVSAILSVVLVSLLLFAYRIWFLMRRKKYIDAAWHKMRRQYILENIALLPTTRTRDFLAPLLSQYSVTLGENISDDVWYADKNGERVLVRLIRLPPGEEIEKRDLLTTYRMAAPLGLRFMVVSTGIMSEACEGFFKRLSPTCFQIIDEDELCGHLVPVQNDADEEAVAKYIIDLLSAKKKVPRIFTQALHPSRMRMYIFSGCLLVVVSFFVPFASYYRVIGILCLLMGLLTILRRDVERTMVQ